MCNSFTFYAVSVSTGADRAGFLFHLFADGAQCDRSGTNLMLYTAPSPLGPFTMRHELNPTIKGKLEMPCQQQGVTAIRGTGAGLQLMWTGERWQQAPDGRKEHDPVSLQLQQFCCLCLFRSIVHGAGCLFFSAFRSLTNAVAIAASLGTSSVWSGRLDGTTLVSAVVEPGGIDELKDGVWTCAANSKRRAAEYGNAPACPPSERPNAAIGVEARARGGGSLMHTPRLRAERPSEKAQQASGGGQMAHTHVRAVPRHQSADKSTVPQSGTLCLLSRSSRSGRLLNRPEIREAGPRFPTKNGRQPVVTGRPTAGWSVPSHGLRTPETQI